MPGSVWTRPGTLRALPAGSVRGLVQNHRVVSSVLPARQLDIDGPRSYHESSACPAGRGAVRLARLLWEQEVGGSNPLAPTTRTRL